MKIIFKLFSVGMVVSLLSLVAYSQESGGEKSGFIRLANAVAPGTGRLVLKVNGENLNPKGYKLGDATGGIPLKPGTHEVVISREGVKEGKTKVNIALNETTIIIPFAEQVPASDTEPAHWEIRVLRLKQQEPEYERSATFVSVSQNPEIRVEMGESPGKWNPVFVKRLGVTQAPIKILQGYAALRSGEIELESIPVAEAGNYVVLLYDDPDGKTQALNFRDQKFLSAD